MGLNECYLSMDHSVYAPIQWETVLQCYAISISHWLDAYTEWPLVCFHTLEVWLNKWDLDIYIYMYIYIYVYMYMYVCVFCTNVWFAHFRKQVIGCKEFSVQFISGEGKWPYFDSDKWMFISANNKSSLLEIMAWRWTGSMPLSETMMTQFTDGYDLSGLSVYKYKASINSLRQSDAYMRH